jgi:hypothetical protein
MKFQNPRRFAAMHNNGHFRHANIQDMHNENKTYFQVLYMHIAHASTNLKTESFYLYFTRLELLNMGAEMAGIEFSFCSHTCGEVTES